MVHTIDSAPALALKNGSEFSLVSHKTLLALFDAMLRARVLDEHLLKQARKKGLSARYASARGQEGAVAAVTIALEARDFLAPSRHYLVPSLIRTRSSKGNSLVVRLSRTAPALPFQATLAFALEQARGQKKPRHRLLLLCLRAQPACGPRFSPSGRRRTAALARGRARLPACRGMEC